MSQEIINVGAAPNDGEGDPIRTAFIKTNNNFSQLFSLSANSISNGNSKVSIPNSNGNIYLSVGNVANIVTVTANGLSTVGNVSAGNVLANAYYYANGAPFIGGGGSQLLVGTATTPVIVPLASANSINVLTAGGNVPVYVS
jgi:hypothetical protein